MNNINKIFSKGTTRTSDIPAVPTDYSSNRVNTPPAPNRRDSFAVSSNGSEAMDLTAAVNQELEILIKSYPNMNIVIQEDKDSSSLTQLAKYLGYGSHLVISKDWLTKMASGVKEFEQGKALLKKVLTQLSVNSKNAPASGAILEDKGITHWTGSHSNEDNEEVVTAIPRPYHNNTSLLGQFKDSFKKTESSMESNPKKKVSSYTVAGLYSRLAGAGSRQQVRSAISEVHRNIGSLQLVSVLGDDKERSKARSAIASLRKLLLRGNRKVQRLSNEELITLREKRAIKLEEERRALAHKIELNRERSKRKTADGSLLREGQLEDLHNSYKHSAHRHEDPLHKRYTEYMPPAALPPSSVPMVSASNTAGSGGAGASLSIQIAPSIALSDY